MRDRMFLLISFLSVFLILTVPSIPAYQYSVVERNIESKVKVFHPTTWDFPIKHPLSNINLLNNSIEKMLWLFITVSSAILTIYWFIIVIKSLQQGDIVYTVSNLLIAIIWLLNTIFAYIEYKSSGDPILS